MATRIVSFNNNDVTVYSPGNYKEIQYNITKSLLKVLKIAMVME